MGSPPVWGLVDGQTAHGKTLIIYEMYQKDSDLDGSFGTM